MGSPSPVWRPVRRLKIILIKESKLILLENQVAVITGSTSGLGRATAILCAKEGVRVVITGRNADRGAAVVKEIAANGGEAVFIPCDVTDEAQIEALFDKTVEHYGKLNILVANSGIPEKKAPVHEMNVDAIRHMLKNAGAEREPLSMWHRSSALWARPTVWLIRSARPVL